MDTIKESTRATATTIMVATEIMDKSTPEEAAKFRENSERKRELSQRKEMELSTIKRALRVEALVRGRSMKSKK